MANLFQRLISWLYPVQLEKTRGELNHELEVNMQNGKVMLDSGRVNYSFGSLQEVFDSAFEKTKLYDAPVKSALILGFGSGSVAELLLVKSDPEMAITGVEADAEVIRLGKKHFPVMNNPHVKIVHDDAFNYITNSSDKFDLIVVDVFIEEMVPGFCQSVEFLRKLRSRLSKNGYLYFNKMLVENDPVSMEEAENNFRIVFSKVRTIRMKRGGGSNCVFVTGV